MATDTPHFDYNIDQAEKSLRIHPENATRNFVPVTFRVGRYTNPAGTSQKTLKLLLFAVQLVDGKNKLMTLDDFLPLFAEFWKATGNGLRPPSYYDHRNLYELWHLWRQNRKTLVSDCFELKGCPFTQKVLAAAGEQSHEYKYP